MRHRPELSCSRIQPWIWALSSPQVIGRTCQQASIQFGRIAQGDEFGLSSFGYLSCYHRASDSVSVFYLPKWSTGFIPIQSSDLPQISISERQGCSTFPTCHRYFTLPKSFCASWPALRNGVCKLGALYMLCIRTIS